MAGKKSSITIVNKRRHIIMEIMNDYKDKDEKLTNAVLLAELKKKNYDISRKTLYEDKLEIAKGDNFIRQITESTYSSDIRNMFQSLDIAEERFWEWLKNPPTIKKQKVEADGKNDDGSQKFRVLEQSVETISPVVIMREIVNVVNARRDLMASGVVRLSVALLVEKYRALEQEVTEARQIIASLPKKTVKLNIKELPDTDVR